MTNAKPTIPDVLPLVRAYYAQAGRYGSCMTKFLVVNNHPCYPTVRGFTDRAEADAYHAEEVRRHHVEDGLHDGMVYTVEVLVETPTKNDY